MSDTSRNPADCEIPWVELPPFSLFRFLYCFNKNIHIYFTVCSRYLMMTFSIVLGCIDPSRQKSNNVSICNRDVLVHCWICVYCSHRKGANVRYRDNKNDVEPGIILWWHTACCCCPNGQLRGKGVHSITSSRETWADWLIDLFSMSKQSFWSVR